MKSSRFIFIHLQMKRIHVSHMYRTSAPPSVISDTSTARLYSAVKRGTKNAALIVFRDASSAPLSQVPDSARKVQEGANYLSNVAKINNKFQETRIRQALILEDYIVLWWSRMKLCSM